MLHTHCRPHVCEAYVIPLLFGSFFTVCHPYIDSVTLYTATDRQTWKKSINLRTSRFTRFARARLGKNQSPDVIKNVISSVAYHQTECIIPKKEQPQYYLQSVMYMDCS